MTRALTGGGVLLHRVTAWWAADGVKSGIARVIGTLLGLLAGVGLLAAAPVLWWPLAIVWLIACWCATPTEAAVDEDEETDGEVDTAGFLAELHRLTPGPKDRIHLAQVAEALDLDPADVRDLCAAAAIPTGPVRVRGRGSSTGIKAEDLPPVATPLTGDVVGVVAPGHSNNNNFRKGFYSEPDPAGGPAARRIRWVTEPAQKAS